MLQSKFTNENCPRVTNLQIGPIKAGKSLESYQKPRNAPKSSIAIMQPLNERENFNMIVEETNKQIIHEEIQRIRKLYEEERSQKWKISQDRLRVENSMKVAEVERNNAIFENQKLKNELKESFGKMRRMQQKISQLTQEYYTAKNQNNLLFEENKSLKEKNSILSNDCSKVQDSMWDLQKTIQATSSDNICLKNEVKSLELQLNDLKDIISSLQKDNELLTTQSRKDNRITNQEVHNLEIRLGNSQTAFEKKRGQMQGKICLLQQENQSLKETIKKLTEELNSNFIVCPSSEPNQKETQISVNTSLNKNNLVDATQKVNEYHIKLMVKDEHIQKLNNHVRKLEQELSEMRVQNMFFNEKERGRRTFSPRKFNQFNYVLKSFDGVMASNHQNTKLLDLQEKDREINKLQELISNLKGQLEHREAEARRYQSEIRLKGIQFQNNLNELISNRTKLNRDLDFSKSKILTLQKQCAEKDRIIVNYVSSCKNKK